MGKTVADKHTGQVRVLSGMCDTCIFYPDNRMRLRPGRREQMVADCLRRDSHIVCHDTLPAGRDGAVCRGFFNRHSRDVWPLRVARALGLIREVPAPPQDGKSS